MIDDEFFGEELDDGIEDDDDLDFDKIVNVLNTAPSNSQISDSARQEDGDDYDEYEGSSDSFGDFYDNYGLEDSYDFDMFGEPEDKSSFDGENDDLPISVPVKKKFKVTYNEDIEDTPVPEKKKKKKSKKGKAVLIVLGVIAFLLVAVVLTASIIISDIFSQINYVPLEHNWEDVVADAAPDIPLYENERYCNVLLIGADGSLDDHVRSDTMMLVSIDTKTHKIRLVSFLRDSFVEIPGHGKNRLNASFAYGGPQLLIQTLEANYRVKIDQYMCVGFGNLEAIVDCMGGVTMEITDAEAKYINRYALRGTKTLVGGVQHLNGCEALNYAQIRKLDSDFGRTNRQRKLIQEIVHQSVAQGPFKLIKIVKQASGYLTTNMTKKQLTHVGLLLTFSSGKSFDELHVPLDDAYTSATVDGMSVLKPDIRKNCEALHSFLFGENYQQ
ncbi:MAG: LCP family protein [Clostridia bacterium]|nr:LCP family protein [Clostridia bacterium]